MYSQFPVVVTWKVTLIRVDSVTIPLSSCYVCLLVSHSSVMLSQFSVVVTWKVTGVQTCSSDLPGWFLLICLVCSISLLNFLKFFHKNVSRRALNSVLQRDKNLLEGYGL
uniref:Uncharacterized protein n=1 Tax=Cacopsylla melanoneura TaxID=428564 RepID=A0A8D8REI7_9HEMI